MAAAAGASQAGARAASDSPPPPARPAFFINAGLYKEVLSAAPEGSDAVTPFSRVTVSYSITLAVPLSDSNTASHDTSVDDIYGDTTPSRHQSSNRWPRPPLSSYTEGQQLLDKLETVELHITGSDPLTPLMPGLDVGISTMKCGEEALFIIDPSRAYSESGTTPSARIPKDAPLAARVTVKSLMHEVDLSAGQRQVVKHVIRAGNGSSIRPVYDARVTYLMNEQSALTGSYLPSAEAETNVGGDVTPDWLDQVLQSMEANEFCVVLVGGRSTYRVLLKAFTNPPQPVDEAALELASRFRSEGNAMFKTRHPKTYNKYAAALHYTNPSHYPSAYKKLQAQILELQAVIHQNSGLVALRGKQLELAVEHFTAAAELTPTKFKLFFNRAKAYRQLKQYELAQKDLAITEHLLLEQLPSTPTTPGAPPIDANVDWTLYKEELATLDIEFQTAQLAATS